jgi:hypothetical protein
VLPNATDLVAFSDSNKLSKQPLSYDLTLWQKIQTTDYCLLTTIYFGC